MSDWDLGIDFGTSYTVAAVARGNDVEVVDIESNGRARIPSAVFLTDDGSILVGTAAQHQSVFAPDRYEPTPKRAFGDGSIFLGDQVVSIAEVAAAVLRRVFVEACRQQGETLPATVRVTHPADWSERRLAVLREATVAAGIDDATLVAEPVAAAMRIARRVAPGRHVAVYDFGGGTFDAAVLVRTDDGFHVSGPPAGRDPLGGEDIDRRVIDHLGRSLGTEDAERWNALTDPSEAGARRDAAMFRAEVQQAKETLSEVLACQLWVPRFEREIQLTRAEIDALIRAEIDATVAVMGEVIAAAGIAPDELAGLYLVGGSSRIPLVAATLWRELGIRPAVQDNPKSVVAMGAAGWSAVATWEPAATAGPVAAPVDDAEWQAELAFSLDPDSLAAGCDCATSIVLSAPGGVVLRVRDQPAEVGSAGELADAVLAERSVRTPGVHVVERRATEALAPGAIEARLELTATAGRSAMFERYAVRDGRAYVVAGHDAARALADELTLVAIAPRRDMFRSALAVRALSGARVVERASLRRRATGEIATCERWLSPDWDVDWHVALLADALERPGARVVRRNPGEVLDLEGEVVTVSWLHGSTPMLARVGVARNDSEVVRVQIALPHVHQDRFAGLARHARRAG